MKKCFCYVRNSLLLIVAIGFISKQVFGATKFEEAALMMPEKLSFAKRVQLLELDDHSGAVGSYASDNELSANLRVWFIGLTEAQKFVNLQKKKMKKVQAGKIKVWTINGVGTTYPDKGIPYRTFIWQQKGWVFVLIVQSQVGTLSAKRKQFGINLIEEIIKIK